MVLKFVVLMRYYIFSIFIKIYQTCNVSFVSTKVNAIAIADLMGKKYKWQLSKLQYPAGAHLVVTDANYSYWKEFAPNVEVC